MINGLSAYKHYLVHINQTKRLIEKIKCIKNGLSTYKYYLVHINQTSIKLRKGVN
jgi:hypothetical protein